MRVSVDVEETTLAEVCALTGEKGKGPALAKAVEEYVKRARAKEFGTRIREGDFDYPDDEDEVILNPIPPLLDEKS